MYKVTFVTGEEKAMASISKPNCHFRNLRSPDDLFITGKEMVGISVRTGVAMGGARVIIWVGLHI